MVVMVCKVVMVIWLPFQKEAVGYREEMAGWLLSALEGVAYKAVMVVWLPFQKEAVGYKDVTAGWLPFLLAGVDCKVVMDEWLLLARGNMVSKIQMDVYVLRANKACS
ncbi:hypothetical protein [Bathymodiolus septemdierum thioautotrophic gill symbiont]|uniref:hypothetical protein n=1 Tax=Bathymodiolus septemdierum thioautotrophic gill symbiont TaxID=113267 RepID=UPI0012EE6E82|nr:hypothetical protein [Bathymodiolus septemdierum thioautotrophic gill symbiont]